MIGALDGNLPPRDYLRQRAVHIYHPLGRACLYHSRDLVCAFLADKVRDRLIVDEQFIGRYEPARDARNEPLGKDSRKRRGELEPDLVLLRPPGTCR